MLHAAWIRITFLLPRRGRDGCKRLLHMRQGASVVREVTCIEHLDACMLLTIERCDDWLRLTGFAAEIERHLRIIEPEAQVILVGWWERDTTVVTKGNRERLHVEDALHCDAA